MNDWQIERIERSHIRNQFNCGKPTLDDFIRTLVNQYEKRGLGRTYVAVLAGEQLVRGYYTIASGAIAFDTVPPERAKKLPRHPIPVVLIARLAVDQTAQRQRLGEKLLLDALNRSLELSDAIGIHAVVVDAIDSDAKAFYHKYRFTSLIDDEFHLILPVSTIRDILGKGD
jgi:GNAT superfamily N-acetyltransferase